MYFFITPCLWMDGSMVIHPIVIMLLIFFQLYFLFLKQLTTLKKSLFDKLNRFKTNDLRNIIKNHIFSSNLSSINLNRKCVINTINPHSYCVSKKDPQFKKALINSDVLLPDGVGIVMASAFLFGKRIKKIAGADIHDYLLKYANQNQKKVFYLGASEKTLSLITLRLQTEFPNIEVGSYSPPYKSEFTSEDSEIMVNSVNNFDPDILFVGMTAPKQEKWVEIHKNYLQASTIVSIGAVFDFYAGTVTRSGPFWINMGLEWLPRLIKEPKRLWRRNFISTPLFLLSLGKAKLGG